MTGPAITVVGSVNLDLVATAATLPAPGGKGANQALAAQRLGASVRLFARVGDDAMADEALALLVAGGVDLSGVSRDPGAPTGVALIAVSHAGENQIVVASGANAAFTPERLGALPAGALICQLEIPLATVAKAVAEAEGFVCLNLAPAAEIPDALFQRAGLIVVNETEAAFYGERLHRAPGLVAVTLGGRGAELRRGGELLASATPPKVDVVDTTGAGDTFVAALTIALLEERPLRDALAFACAAGALATTRAGAQPSLPLRSEVEALP